ncbi:MAG TPA: sigma-70 family RNA polymerase sigma factor [Nannocystaceae bacterium]|nr:sigma-70 family RNA polymerase sigma factor [Nannocystaceae bacterium]
MADDDELLAAWRGGDRSAGDMLIARWFDPICRFFRSKLGDDVEDLIQRTFLDCLESRDRLRQASFRSFLFAVARNRLFDELRREHRQRVDQLGTISLADLRTRPSDRIARSESRDAVIRAMQTLPLDLQITLKLAYWEELAGTEIASALGISEHTVRSRLSRARGMLRTKIEQEVAAAPALAQTLAALAAWTSKST